MPADHHGTKLDSFHDAKEERRPPRRELFADNRQEDVFRDKLTKVAEGKWAKDEPKRRS